MTNTATFLALIALLGGSACDRSNRNHNNRQSPAVQADDRSQEPQSWNTKGGAAADDSIVGRATAGLDPADAKATFVHAPHETLEGSATLNQRSDGVQIEVEISKASPGMHGIHIHETADCSDIPNQSMGSHFAPFNRDHGLPFAASHHLGDLGNLAVEEDGEADFEIFVPQANLKPGHRASFLDRSLVIHQYRDVGSGESGLSGTPIACAAIVAD